CWLPVSRIGLHRRGVERVNCGPKLLDLGEKGVYSSYTYVCPISPEHGQGCIFHRIAGSAIIQAIIMIMPDGDLWNRLTHGMKGRYRSLTPIFIVERLAHQAVPVDLLTQPEQHIGPGIAHRMPDTLDRVRRNS